MKLEVVKVLNPVYPTFDTIPRRTVFRFIREDTGEVCPEEVCLKVSHAEFIFLHNSFSGEISKAGVYAKVQILDATLLVRN